MKIAEQIVLLRTRLGLTQGDLAERLEVSRQSVSKWETGASVPEIDKLVKMARLFGVSLDELVTGECPVPAASAEKAITVQQIIAVSLFVLAGLCMAVTVLFGNAFGIHTSEGLLLAVWFALLGAIVWNPEDEGLRINLSAVYAAAVAVLTVLYFLRIYGFAGVGIFVLIGLTLGGWAAYAGKK